MEPSIHEKIKNKIENREVSPSVKEFLQKILAEELRHLEEKGWRYGKKYDRYIKNYASQFKEETVEDAE